MNKPACSRCDSQNLIAKVAPIHKKSGSKTEGIWFNCIDCKSQSPALLNEIEAAKEMLNKQLKNKVLKTKTIINKLKFRQDLNNDLLSEYESVIDKFLDSENISILAELRKIDSRPSLEGAETDFTTATSIEIDGQWISISDMIEEIEKAVVEIQRA